MNKKQVLLSLAFAIVLGVVVVSTMTGGLKLPFFQQEAPGPSSSILAAGEATAAALPSSEDEEVQATETPEASPVRSAPGLTPAPRGTDLPDVLLLYDPQNPTPFDANFCLIAEYYGLLCAAFDLNQPDFLPADLLDPKGRPYKLIGISAANLSRLTYNEILTLQFPISEDLSSLLIYNINESTSSNVLSQLTRGEILGARPVQDSVRNWTVTTRAVEVTREFSGLDIQPTDRLIQDDLELVVSSRGEAIPLIVSTDDRDLTYPIFAQAPYGRGIVYVHSGSSTGSLMEQPLRRLYYRTENFTTIIPIMIAMRAELGDEVWHNPVNYANLTLDNIPLRPDVDNFDFHVLLRQMESHHFFSTIAFAPARYPSTSPEIAALITANPGYFSLVQYGNTGSGYEFYYYEVPSTGSGATGGPAVPELYPHPARPFAEQEAAILEGLQRMLTHQIESGVPFERVMVFPEGISPEDTLVVLKRMNYLATVNAQSVPLGASRTGQWDEGMSMASLSYANFPVVTRRQHVTRFTTPDPVVQDAVFDLFIDRPALFWADPLDGDLFTTGMDEFNLIADRVNSLPGELEWRGLGDVLRRAYRQRLNDDGSFDVQMFTPAALLNNPNSTPHTYHFMKEETLNVPIKSVLVNGQEYPYRVEDGMLLIDVVVPGRERVEVRIAYENEMDASGD